MKKSFSRIIALVLCFTVLFTGTLFTASAAEGNGAEAVLENVGESIEKGFYNTLNAVVEMLVKVICILYPNPPSWADISEYSRDTLRGASLQESPFLQIL